MHKKKITAIMTMTLGICLCFSACGGQKAKTADELTEEDIEQALSQMETMREEDLDTPAAGASEQKTAGVEPTQEILDADIYSQKLQLGNSVFTFPEFPVNELLEANVSFEELDPNTTIIDAGSLEYDNVTIDGKTYKLRFRNYSDQRQLLKDCVVSQNPPYISRISETRNNYICPKGIKIGSTLDELLAAYGEPTHVDIDTYFYAEKLVSCDISGISVKRNFNPNVLIYKEGESEWYALNSKCIKFQIDLNTNTIQSICFFTPEPNRYLSKSIESSQDSVKDEALFHDVKAKYKASMNYPDYFMSYDPDYMFYYSETPKSLIFSSFNYLSSTDIYKTSLTKYTDASLTEYCNAVANKMVFTDDDKLGYEYKIHDNGTADAYVYRITCAKEGEYANVRIFHFNEDFVAIKNENNEVAPVNGETELTAEDISSLSNVFFDIASNMEVEVEFLE